MFYTILLKAANWNTLPHSGWPQFLLNLVRDRVEAGPAESLILNCTRNAFQSDNY